MNKIETYVGYGICVVLVLMLFAGCGKKGPPLPPDRKQPAGITDLKTHIENNVLTLKWTLPLGVDRKTAEKAAFVVFRSRKMTYQACLDCPDVFTRVTEIPFFGDKWAKVENNRMSYMEIIEPGFAYAYKILIYVSGEATGPHSNVVRFVH